MRTKRGEKVAYIRRPRTVAIDVLLSFNLAVVFNLNIFPFPPSKPQFLGDVPMNRHDNATMHLAHANRRRGMNLLRH
jgi:hypothetical protein